MTLKQKIGQLFMVGFDSLEVNSHITNLIKNFNVGNVILFERNCKNPKQILKLTQDLQKLAMEYNGVPLFIGIDQENGMVVRISDGVCAFPGNMAQSSGASSMEEIYNVARYTGQMLSALGINYNLAPSLDINNNPQNPIIGIRSFGEDPETVAPMGLACIKGFQDEGIIATAKHFPGHGDTEIDSHLALPCIEHDKDRLDKIELYPFKEAINSGVKSIMTTHINFPAYEPVYPATLSKNVLTDLLREELNFEGLIITDCMEMKAIDDIYTVSKATVMAIEAGANIVCISHTEKLQVDALEETLTEALQNPEFQAKVDEASEKVLQFKSQLNFKEIMELDESKLKPSDGEKLAKKISTSAIKVTTNGVTLPIDVAKQKVLIVSPDSRGMTGADGLWHIPNFGVYASNKIPLVHKLRIEQEPALSMIEEILEIIRHYDVIIMCLYNAQFMKYQLFLANKLLESHHNVVSIAMRNPYDIDLLVHPQTTIKTFEYTPLSMDSLLSVLFG